MNHASPHAALLSDYEDRRARSLQMGGPAKLAARRERGLLNARERIGKLLDDGSFIESGQFAVSSYSAEDAGKTPADGKVCGFGRIDGREVGVVSNDFTVKGASSSATNGRKIGHMKRVTQQRGLPLVFLGESSGARMPDTMGSRGMGTMLGNDPTQYQRMRETPWASAVLGFCYGSSTWYSAFADFTVMRKGAIMAVSSPQLVSLAIKQAVDPEDIGGWRLHAETTGLVHAVVDTDDEALQNIRRFLSYMPSHRLDTPPVHAVPAGSGAEMDGILDDLPALRTQVYDVRKIVRRVVDRDSFFEFKPRFGKVAATGLARLDGHSVGIIANNPLHKGGALDTDACEKITSFIVMCDSFNIPLVLFVDTPGFIIGLDAERRRAPGKIANFMGAISLTTVPKLSVILRKTYGQAYLNMGGGRNSDEVAAWPTAEVSFMNSAYATQIVHGIGPDDAGFADRMEEMDRDNDIYGLAGMFGVQSVILPQQTREYLIRMLQVHRMRPSRGIGQQLMRTWPTTY